MLSNAWWMPHHSNSILHATIYHSIELLLVLRCGYCSFPAHEHEHGHSSDGDHGHVVMMAIIDFFPLFLV